MKLNDEEYAMESIKGRALFPNICKIKRTFTVPVLESMSNLLHGKMCLSVHFCISTLNKNIELQ